MFGIFERLRTRPMATTSIAAIAGTMLATLAAAQSGSYADDEWWEVSEWFDGNDTSYEENDDGFGFDDDAYGYDDYDYDYDDYGYSSDDDWWSDDAEGSYDDSYGAYDYGYDYGYDSGNSLDTGWYETGYDDREYWNDYDSSSTDYDYYSDEWYDDNNAFSGWYDGWAYN